MNATERPRYELSPDELKEEMKYWSRRGTKTAAFLLVIPGSTIMAAGVGLLLGPLVPATVIGFGGGLFVWGLIVALSK